MIPVPKPITLSVVYKVLFFIYSKSALFIARVSARALNKRFTIQRRLAWSLCKDDTQNRREANLFFSFAPLKNHLTTTTKYLLESYHLSLQQKDGKKLFQNLIQAKEFASTLPVLVLLYLVGIVLQMNVLVYCRSSLVRFDN